VARLARIGAPVASGKYRDQISAELAWTADHLPKAYVVGRAFHTVAVEYGTRAGPIRGSVRRSVPGWFNFANALSLAAAKDW
jgi:hypothetical protein